MTPAEQAKAICEKAGDSFTEVLEAHLLQGWVFATPQLFVLARPVPKGADVTDLWKAWPATICNAWFVWVGVGEARRLMHMMPYNLPWVGFARVGRHWPANHWVSTDALQWRLRKVRVSTCARVKT